MILKHPIKRSRPGNQIFASKNFPQKILSTETSAKHDLLKFCNYLYNLTKTAV